MTQLQQMWASIAGLHDFVFAILLTLVTTFILWLFRSKVKIIYGSTSNNYHAFNYGPAQAPVSVSTEKFYLQNTGKSHASNLEIVFSSRPSSFNLWSPRAHSVELLDNGNFVISVPSLAAKELLIVDMIDVEANGPRLLAVNCPDAIAQEVEFLPVRQFGNTFNAFVAFLMLAGLIGSFYFILSTFVALSA